VYFDLNVIIWYSNIQKNDPSFSFFLENASRIIFFSAITRHISDYSVFTSNNYNEKIGWSSDLISWIVIDDTNWLNPTHSRIGEQHEKWNKIIVVTAVTNDLTTILVLVLSMCYSAGDILFSKSIIHHWVSLYPANWIEH